MILNPLHEYCEDSKEETKYDIELEDISEKARSLFYRKLHYRLGEIVVLFNYFERLIDECIINTMNERSEDERVWILIRDYNIDKKIKTLSELYINVMRTNNNYSLLEEHKLLFKRIENIRIQRNTFIHSNWLNDNNLEYFELKVKKINELKGYMRVNKKIQLKDLEVYIETLVLLFSDLEKYDETISCIEYKDKDF